MHRPLCSLCVLLLLLLVVCSLVVCEAGVQFNLSKAASSPPSSADPSSSGVLLSGGPSGLESLFISYVREHRKVYTAADFQRRFSVFSANVALIDAHNADRSSTHRLGLTEHADWTATEFHQYRLGYRRPIEAVRGDSGCDTSVYSSAVPTASFDWRTSNAVGAVKNQGKPLPRTLRQQTAAQNSTASLVQCSPVHPYCCCYCCSLLVSVQVNVARVGRSPLRAVWKGCGPFGTSSCCR